MFKNVYSLYFAFCTQPAFYSQSALCILHTVCILPLVRSLRFTLTAVSTHLQQKKISGIVIEFFLDSKKAVYVSYSIVIIC